MKRLVLTKKRSNIQAEVRDGGTLLGRVAATFADDSHFDRAVEAMDIDKSLLLQAIDRLQQSLQDSLEVPLQAVAPFTVSVRGRQQPASTGPWAKLYLLPGAPAAVVESAYKTLALAAHPDRSGGSNQKMVDLNLAVEALRRAGYRK